MGITAEYGVQPEEVTGTQTPLSVEAGPHPLELKLSYRFKRIALLQEALTHPSQAHVARQRGEAVEDNQRLEFLGDAVLDLLVGERLFHVDPLAPPGLLTQRRIALVGEPALARLGRTLGLSEVLLVGPGEAKQGLANQVSVVADALEAVLGAIYLDGGLEAARQVVDLLYGKELDALKASQELKNPKIQIQELSQGRWTITPVYVVTRVGTHFEAELSVGDKVKLVGKGATRKLAELEAAEAGILALQELIAKEEAAKEEPSPVPEAKKVRVEARDRTTSAPPREPVNTAPSLPTKLRKAGKAPRPPVEVVVLPRRPKGPSSSPHEKGPPHHRSANPRKEPKR